MDLNLITIKELLNGNQLETQSEEIQKNLATLHFRMNIIRKAWAKPMKVTSGLRSMDDHIRIYKDIAKKQGKEFDASKVPMKSKHLFGQAVDIYDPNKELQTWCLENIPLLEKVGLWMEDFNYTKNWVHFQCVQPASGKRFFIP